MSRTRLFTIGAAPVLVLSLYAVSHPPGVSQPRNVSHPPGVFLPSGGETAVKRIAAASHVSQALDPRTERGLAWLAAHQNPDGGWSQGEESAEMGGTESVADVSNVADTSMAALALLRAGSTPESGPHAEQLRRAVEFVSGEVLQSPAEGLAVTRVQGTRVQAKLGAAIDTFAAALLLAEVKDRMPMGEGRHRAQAALEKTIHKMERAQQTDGTWGRDGWAPALAQGLASKAINRAARNGLDVSEQVRVRAEDYARAQFDAEAGTFTGEGAAGVALYGAASTMEAMVESDRTNREKEEDLRAQAASPAAPAPARQAARDSLARMDQNRQALKAVSDIVVSRFDDPEFVAGFGSNGGEEFLSYLSIGESLHQRGGDDWRTWFASMADNLGRVQNQDGSWTGHHCITGRTFCTAAALMVLTIDRAPQPVAVRLKRS